MEPPCGPREELERFLRPPLEAQLLFVAAKLGIADLLRSGPQSAEDLARSAGAHAPTLHRLLRGLAGIGVLARSRDGRFALTPLGDLLRSDRPGSLRDEALLYGELFPAWGSLLDSVRTGRTAFEHAFGEGLFARFARHKGLGGILNRGMADRTSGVAAAVRDAYDFSGVRRLVDVGGGYGAFLAAVLPFHPAMRAVLFDLPAVVAGARRRLATAPFSDRCELAGGDFFESVPKGGDLYVLQFVLHDWDDERAVRILANCRRAMTETASRLLIVERFLPEPPREDPGLIRADLEMLALTGGRERTVSEYRELLAGAGLRLRRGLRLRGSAGLLESAAV